MLEKINLANNLCSNFTVLTYLMLSKMVYCYVEDTKPTSKLVDESEIE